MSTHQTWILCGLLWIGAYVPRASAETTEERASLRTLGGAFAGAGITMGRLSLVSGSALVRTRLTAVPTLEAGLEAHPREELGLYARLGVGLGADLDVPNTEATLQYNVHQLAVGTRARLFFGERADAPCATLGLGLVVVKQDVQDHNPALLVSSVVGGPALDGGLRWPLLDARVVVGARLRLELPTFVRESPRDSGDPSFYFGYGGDLEVELALIEPLWLRGFARYIDRTIEFEGDGTRGAGTRGATSHDRFLTSGLTVFYRL